MTERDVRDRDDRLYLEDLRVGQQFTSGGHGPDAAQIKVFARQFDPQPFHLDDGLAKDTLFAGLMSGAERVAVSSNFR